MNSSATKRASGQRRKHKAMGEMEFCPTCSSLLLVEHAGRLRYFCPTCAYVFNIEQKITKRIALKNKEVDDVLGGEESWKNCDRTMATCPKCSYGRAYFMLVQIRSADEPSTAFYKCCNPNCGHRWRED